MCPTGQIEFQLSALYYRLCYAVTCGLILFLCIKMSAASREDYEAVQEEMGLAKHEFLKHVECRWLSLQPVVLRILE